MIVSVTLADNQQEVIEGCLASIASHVDACILIDTGITDNTIKVARKAIGRGKLSIAKYRWRNDFSDARNFALTCARDIQADWAIMLDTDERVLWDSPGEIRALSESNACYLLFDDTRTYTRERIFNLAKSCDRFVGPVHESFISDGARAVSRAGRIACIPKSAAQLQEKFIRDRLALETHTRANPNDPRWWYYLGDTHSNLGEHEKAIAAFARCIDCHGWDEQAAWAYYRIASCQCSLKNYSRAIEAAAAGFTEHAGIAELAWIAAYASYELKKYSQAVRWARMSLAIGKDDTRIGFCNHHALGPGPYDILRFAKLRMGDTKGAVRALRGYEAHMKKAQP